MKRGLCAVLCVVLIIPLSSCWSRREPKTLALVSSALYELTEDGTYKATAEIINPEAQGGPQGGGGGKSPTLTVTGEGKSLPEALRMTSATLERNLFAGQTLARFYSEAFAKKDIMSVQDFFLRDVLTDENPLVVIIKGDSPELLYTATLGLTDTVGNYIDNLHQTQDNFISTAVFIDTLRFIKDYYTDGKQPVAGLLELVEDNTKASKNDDKGGESSGAKSGGAGGDDQSKAEGGSKEKKYKIKYEGLAAFKDEKLAGYLDGMDARAYKIVTNIMGNSIVSLPEETSVTVVRIDSSKAALTASFDEDKIKLGVTVKMASSIIQAGNELDISKAKALKIVEQRFNKQIEDDISATIKKAQTEFKSDIFGFGVAMHARHPERFKKIKDNWDELFSQAEVKVIVESTITRSGEFKAPFKMKT